MSSAENEKPQQPAAEHEEEEATTITPEQAQEVDSVFRRVFSDVLMTLDWNEGKDLLVRADDLIPIAVRSWEAGRMAAIDRENSLILKAVELRKQAAAPAESAGAAAAAAAAPEVRLLPKDTTLKDLLIFSTIRFRKNSTEERAILQSLMKTIDETVEKVTCDAFENMAAGPERTRQSAAIRAEIEAVRAQLRRLHVPKKSLLILEDRISDIIAAVMED